jgi:hypothetical protein
MRGSRECDGNTCQASPVMRQEQPANNSGGRERRVLLYDASHASCSRTQLEGFARFSER